MKNLALLLALSCATPCLAQTTPPVSPHRAPDDDRSFMPPDRREQLRQADPAVFHKMFPKADVTKPVTNQ